MKITIKYEKKIRIVREFNITEDELTDLKYGDNPFEDELESEIANNISEGFTTFTAYDEDENWIVRHER